MRGTVITLNLLHMKQREMVIAGAVLVAILLLVVIGYFQYYDTEENLLTDTEGTAISTSTPKNATYLFGDEEIRLTDGRFARATAPGSATMETIEIFGEPVFADLDGDKDEDAAMFVVQNSGGSGTFYYVALAINANGEYRGTNAMLLGDRIAPQNINVIEGRAVANFAERKAGEPFTTAPSVGKSIYVQYDPKTNEIGEWVKDFEGEADIQSMSLSMKTWEWIRTEYSDGKTLSPKKAGKFTLTFKSDGSVSVGTDCNAMGGTYTTANNSLLFGEMVSTLMFCDGSQEEEFSSMLSLVSQYSFTGKGELVLRLKDNKGSVFLR